MPRSVVLGVMAAPEIANGRVMVAHLGSGASMCALKGGQSVDSSMGFTARGPHRRRPGLQRQTRHDISVNEMLPVLIASKGLRRCPPRCEEAGIYLKELAGFLVSFGELAELRQARGKDALCR